MNSTRIYALFLRQMYLIRDNPTRFVQIFGWSFFDILLWGFLSSYLTALGGGTQFTPLFLGAIVVWNFAIRVMHGSATAFFEDVWARNFLNIFASPVTIEEYLTSLVATAIVTAVLGIAVMMVLVYFVFGVSVFMYGWLLWFFLLILFISGTALGILSIAIVLRFGPSAEWFVWPIPEFVAPFIGVLYPVSVLPSWVQQFSRLLPPTYVFEGARATVLGYGYDIRLLIFGFGLSIVYLVLSYLFFKRVYARAVRGGLIARYSAESV